MFSKTSIISIIIFLLAIHLINSLPNIFCDPLFVSMTKLVNNSYFIIDYKGKYWTVEENGKISKSSPKGTISKLKTESNRVLPSPFDTFDLTFIINFNEKCEIQEELFYGLKVILLYHFINENKLNDLIYL